MTAYTPTIAPGLVSNQELGTIRADIRRAGWLIEADQSTVRRDAYGLSVGNKVRILVRRPHSNRVRVIGSSNDVFALPKG